MHIKIIHTGIQNNQLQGDMILRMSHVHLSIYLRNSIYIHNTYWQFTGTTFLTTLQQGYFSMHKKNIACMNKNSFSPMYDVL